MSPQSKPPVIQHGDVGGSSNKKSLVNNFVKAQRSVYNSLSPTSTNKIRNTNETYTKSKDKAIAALSKSITKTDSDYYTMTGKQSTQTRRKNKEYTLENDYNSLER